MMEPHIERFSITMTAEVIAMIGGKADNRVFFQVMLPQKTHDPAKFMIEPGDVAVVVSQFLPGKLLHLSGHIGPGHRC